MVHVQRPGRTVEPGVAEVEDAPVGGDQPVALAVRCGGHADDGLVEVQGTGGTVEPGVAEVEDAPVGGDQPVALAVRGRSHADDGLVEVQRRGGAEEPGVAVGEDTPVRSSHPVALAVGSGGGGDARLRHRVAASDGRDPVGGDGTIGPDNAVARCARGAAGRGCHHKCGRPGDDGATGVGELRSVLVAVFGS